MKFKKITAGLYRATTNELTIEIAKQYISNTWSLSMFNDSTNELIVDVSLDKKSHCIEYITNYNK
tara:strand:- start:207 stop:401 length:195 start_codon:yes stop_codon:yes gene_type:complete